MLRFFFFASFFVFTSSSVFAWNSLGSGVCKKTRKFCWWTIGNAGGGGACCAPENKDILYCSSQDYCESSRFYRWSNNSIPLAWTLNLNGRPSGFQNFTDNLLIQTMQKAWDAWTHPVCTSFQHQYQGTTTDIATRDNKLVLYLPSEETWALYGSGSGTLAFTQPRADNTGIMYEGDIVFNPNPVRPWGLDQSNSGQVSLMHTSVHEIGHAIGFGHTALKDAIMYFSSNAGNEPYNGLPRDEIDAVCTIYPALGKKACTTDLQCGQCGTCQNGVCDSKGKGKIECPCASSSDCDTGLECKDQFCQRVGGGESMDPCSSRTPCKAGLHCFRVERGDICLKACGKSTGLPPGKPGGPCLYSGACSDGSSCLVLDSGITVCVRTCNSKADCNGGSCEKIAADNEDKYCQCFDDKECNSGMVCNTPGKVGTAGVCTTKTTQDGTCEQGFSCQNTHIDVYACQPDAGTRKIGESCDKTNHCEGTLRCIQTSPTAGTGICVEDCQQNKTCKEGGICINTSWATSVCQCFKNEQCPKGKYCDLNSYGVGQCTIPKSCGNGVCDTAAGIENCETCPSDCGCKSGATCRQGACVDNCGNGSCEYALGENCETCEKDCKCQDNQECKVGICIKKQIEIAKEKTTTDASVTDTCTSDNCGVEKTIKEGCGCEEKQSTPWLGLFLFFFLLWALPKRKPTASSKP